MANKKSYLVHLTKGTSKKGLTFWRSPELDISSISRQVNSIGFQFSIQGKLQGNEEQIDLVITPSRNTPEKPLYVSNKDTYKSVSIGLWYKQGISSKSSEPYRFYSSQDFDSRNIEEELGKKVRLSLFFNQRKKENSKEPDYTVSISKSVPATKGSGKKDTETSSAETEEEVF